MNFVESIRSGFTNYCSCNHRASRSEFWYWTLFTVLVSLPLMSADQFIIRMPILPDGSGPLENAWFLFTLLPSLMVTVRRLHDINRSGYWWLLAFSIIGIPLLIYWWVQRGTLGENRFGADPLA